MQGLLLEMRNILPSVGNRIKTLCGLLRQLYVWYLHCVLVVR